MATFGRPKTSCSTGRAPSSSLNGPYEEQLKADEDGSQASLAGERALASIERVSDDLQEKVDQFEESEDALRERFQDATA
jgi:hypothetical protein